MARGDSTTVEAPASNGTTEATPLTPEQQAAADAKKAQRAARKAQRSYIVVPMPANMKAIFEEQAKAADKSVGPHVRDYLAQQLGIEIPVTVTTRRVKYATDEERNAAKLARRSERSTTMKSLMAVFQKLKAGGMSPEQAVAEAARQLAEGNAPKAEGEAVATPA